MKFDKLRQELEALRTIRDRWQLRGWKFTPLERVDGVNETLESLEALRNSPICWSRVIASNSNLKVAQLLDDLEEFYRYAFEPWVEHKTVFESEASQREFLRWPTGMFPAAIQRDARYRFWELVTTSRFSVNALPSMFELQEVNWTTSTVTIRHAVSLASMVCIHNAICALESVACDWDDDSKELIQDAWDARNQAEAWLLHLNTLNFDKAILDQASKVATAQKSEKARAAAKNPRRGRDLTIEILAAYFNERPGQKWERLCDELAKKYKVSESTVARRYRKAKGNNLVA